MRRILFVLVAVIALAGVVAYMAPASGQADKRTGDALAGKLARREVQRSPLSIPSREMVQVETLIPAGVESGWHVHPGEEVGYIIAGQVEMRVQGRATVVLRPGDGFLIPPRTPHNARDIGPETGQDAVDVYRRDRPADRYVRGSTRSAIGRATERRRISPVYDRAAVAALAQREMFILFISSSILQQEVHR